MFPYFTVFGKMITTYFLLSLIGVFVAGIFTCHLARKRVGDDNDTIIVLLFSSIGVLLGGHLLYGLTNIRFIPTLFTAETVDQLIERAVTVFGGSVFYGGLFGAILVATIAIRAQKLNFSVYSDMLTLAIPLFHSFARCGCFFSGCCYGIECDFGITVTGNTLVPQINDVPRFPVQLLEAVLNILLFAVLYGLYKKSLTTHTALQGKLLPIYLLSYSVIRFFDEFLRGDDIRGFIFGLSTSQFISIFLFAISSIILIKSTIHTSHKKEISR
ncbi:MAG: prolipoprotein diacylglyceryl transferase [Clostridia bacterium]|nr:prolipoprotein diacylglyceryl transferase [Clostridia bacterium]